MVLSYFLCYLLSLYFVVVVVSLTTHLTFKFEVFLKNKNCVSLLKMIKGKQEILFSIFVFFFLSWNRKWNNINGNKNNETKNTRDEKNHSNCQSLLKRVTPTKNENYNGTLTNCSFPLYLSLCVCMCVPSLYYIYLSYFRFVM